MLSIRQVQTKRRLFFKPAWQALLIATGLLAGLPGQAAAVWQESFDTDGYGTRYNHTVGAAFNDGVSDFFIRTDGGDISTAYQVAGQDGSFFYAGQDLDGGGGPATQTLSFNAIDITGLANLTFTGLFAEDNDGSNQDWDDTDGVTMAYQIDGSGWQPLLQFAEIDNGTIYNQEPGQDTDFDGIADGAALTDTFTEFSASIPGTGSSLELRITLTLDAGDEDIAFDNFRVEDGGGPGVSLSTTKIHHIQGSGTASPMQTQEVTIEGIVVADYQDTLSGFYVQEEDADADADASTSEGIFVYSTTAVAVGDQVRVTGTVLEYNELTELSPVSDVSVVSSGNALPAPVVITLPLSAVTDLEAYEGMYVTFTQTLYVTEHYNLGRYGEVPLSSGDRLDQPTNVATPGAAANAVQAANDLNQVLLDDADTTQNPEPIVFSNNPPMALSADNPLRGGDTVTGLTGVISYSFNTYRVYPTVQPPFVNANPRPTSAPSVGGSLKVAAFNVLNYFTTTDGSGAICGPLANQGCRGADSASELTRQQDKLVAALTTLDADIIGLMEVENTNQDAIADLAARLPGYAYIANPAGDGVELGGDAITVGILYKTATATPVGNAATIAHGFGSVDLGAACGSGSDGMYPFDGFNRKPLAQTFQDNNGEKFTVVVNHFKSKGSLTGYSADNDQSDGQGNNNCTRTQAAETLLAWLAGDPTGSADSDFMVMGDLNAYAMEDPVTAFTDAGYSTVVSGYSYVYNGQWGALDHVLTSADLTSQVTGAAKWHINADEPRSLDYNEEFKSAGQVTSLYNPDMYRTSDHDPVVTGLSLGGAVVSPADGSTLSGGDVTFTWQGAAIQKWWLYLGSSVGRNDYFDSGNPLLTTEATGLPVDGRVIYARLWYDDGVSGWQFLDYSYTAHTVVPTLTAPVNGSPLSGNSATFTWEGAGVQRWWMYAGSGTGSNDYFDSGNLETAGSVQATGLPVDGSTVYVRLWYYNGSVWQFLDYTYTAHTVTPSMVSPTDGSTLSGTEVTFHWQGDGVVRWWLYVGSAAGTNNLFDSGNPGTATSTAVTGLPQNGGTVYVRLWYDNGSGTWQKTDYSYTAVTM